MIGIEKGKSNQIAELYGSMLLILVALLHVETRNVIGGLNCPVNLVAKLYLLFLLNWLLRHF